MSHLTTIIEEKEKEFDRRFLRIDINQNTGKIVFQNRRNIKSHIKSTIIAILEAQVETWERKIAELFTPDAPPDQWSAERATLEIEIRTNKDIIKTLKGE